MTLWSCRVTPRRAAALATSRVVSISDFDGVGSPDGWLWAMIKVPRRNPRVVSESKACYHQTPPQAPPHSPRSDFDGLPQADSEVLALALPEPRTNGRASRLWPGVAGAVLRDR